MVEVKAFLIQILDDRNPEAVLEHRLALTGGAVFPSEERLNGFVERLKDVFIDEFNIDGEGDGLHVYISTDGGRSGLITPEQLNEEYEPTKPVIYPLQREAGTFDPTVSPANHHGLGTIRPHDPDEEPEPHERTHKGTLHIKDGADTCDTCEDPLCGNHNSEYLRSLGLSAGDSPEQIAKKITDKLGFEEALKVVDKSIEVNEGLKVPASKMIGKRLVREEIIKLI